MENKNSIELSDYTNKLIEKETVSLEEYLAVYKSKIIQESEQLFVSDFLYPLFGEKNIKYVIPQYPFIDSEGRARRIDFGIIFQGKKGLSLKPWGIALKFLFLHHENILFPND